MKPIMTVSLFLGFSCFVHAFSLSHEEINNMISQIKEKRTGIKLDQLEKTPNPFAINQKLDEVVQETVIDTPKKVEDIVNTYRLTAIFNRAAFINGKWYKVGSRLGNYTISHLGTNSVTILNGDIEKELTLPKKKKLIKFKGD